ncbi:hypothetical protein [Gloeothece verrucosa]|nr:hypothetical protein [Gloeothece verrucosa]
MVSKTVIVGVLLMNSILRTVMMQPNHEANNPFEPGFRLEFVLIYCGVMALVFYTHSKCYQFGVVAEDGSVERRKEIYYTAGAALEAAKNWIALKNFENNA